MNVQTKLKKFKKIQNSLLGDWSNTGNSTSRKGTLRSGVQLKQSGLFQRYPPPPPSVKQNF